MKLRSSVRCGVLELRCFGTTDVCRELDVYEKWMSNGELRYETATDPMSRRDIEVMQTKWLHDEDKFDYIIWVKEANNMEPIGDIGLFYKTNENGTVEYRQGEISMMIANPSYRRRGLGRVAFEEAMIAAKEVLGTTSVIAKIKDTNTASIHFFEKLGFKETSRSSYFEEVTMEGQI